MTRSALERIEAECVPVPWSGCLVFTGRLDRDGYPAAKAGGVQLHRAALEHKLGRKLGRRTFACHRCDVRACCNPEHLFAGTNRANVRDKVSKNRQARVPNGGVRFDLSKARELRAERARGATRAELAASYSISVRQVERIVAHQRWPEPVLEAAE